jgi:hypothetical protein
MADDWLGRVGDALAAGAKGAAAGSVVPGIGTVAGGVIGVAMDLLPGAAHWLGGDSATAQKAVKAVQDITGFSDPASQRTALAADQGMADDLRIQLAQIASERRAEENRSAETRQAAVLADVAGARTQTVQLAQAGSRTAWGAPAVSLVIVIGFFGAFAALMWARKIEDAGVSAMINMMVGGLVAGLTTVLTYWLGSSDGSRRKTELMAQQVPTPPSPGVIVPADDVQPAR